MPIDRDEDLRALLSACRTIAVVGIKAGATDDAFRVPLSMQRAGFRILPVNPKLDHVLGERCAASLAEIDEPIDLVNVFRAPANVPAHVDEILALSPRPRGVWLQLGIRHAESAARLEAAGIAVVEDLCLMVEQQRLGVEPPER